MKLLLLVCLCGYVAAQRGGPFGGRGGGPFGGSGPFAGGLPDKEECLSDLEEALDCVEENSPSKEEMMEKLQPVMQGVSGCFEQAGCDDPVPLMKEMGKCLKEEMPSAMMPLGAKLGECLDEQGVQIPDFLMDRIASGEGPPRLGAIFGGKGKGKGRGKGGKGKEMKKRMGKKMKKALGAVAKEVCDGDRDKAKEAMRCSKGVAKEAIRNMPAPPEMDCPAPEKACLMHLVKPKRALCACAQQADTAAIKEAVGGVIRTCKQRAGVQGSLSNKERQMIEKKINKIGEKLCERPDPSQFLG